MLGTRLVLLLVILSASLGRPQDPEDPAGGGEGDSGRNYFPVPADSDPIEDNIFFPSLNSNDQEEQEDDDRYGDNYFPVSNEDAIADGVEVQDQAVVGTVEKLCNKIVCRMDYKTVTEVT